MSEVRLRAFPFYGAAIDVIAFFASFAVFGGAHGPAGPMFMLWVVNRPLSELRVQLFPPGTTSEAMDWILGVTGVAINGALYGFIVALLVALARTIFSRRASP